MEKKLLKIGISSCLLGDNVRFNGGHKLNRICRDNIGQYADFVRVCPEVEIGLSTPRNPIRLARQEGRIEVVETDNADIKYTRKLQLKAEAFLRRHPDLCGFIGTKGSPSCAFNSAKIYTDKGIPVSKGDGQFTYSLQQLNPLLPVEDSGRLNDHGLLENFITRAYTLQRWHSACEGGITKKALIQFHSEHKYLVMSHDYASYKALGKMLADMRDCNLDSLSQEYIKSLMTALSKVPTRRQHCNVLQHLLGYLKKQISGFDKKEILSSIESYRDGVVPLIVPLTLLQHHFRIQQQHHQYMLSQYYLAPYPAQMGLRSHILQRP